MIGVVLDRLAKGGVTKLAALEVREMIRQGVPAQLLVLWHEDAEDELFRDVLQGIPVRMVKREIPRIFRWHFRIPGFSFFASFHLAAFFYFPLILRRGEYECFYAHGTYTCFATLGSLLFRRVPYFAYIHDSIYYIIKKAYLDMPQSTCRKTAYGVVREAGFWVDRLLLRCARGVAKQSSVEADYIAKVHGVRNFAVVPPATGTRLPAPKTSVGGYFLAFTKWDFTKNFDLLLQVARECPDVVIRVAGFFHPPEYEQEVRQRIQQEGLAPRMPMIGAISEQEIASLMRDAIALIHPLHEAWGSSIYEAACHSTTFVAVRGSGIQDYLRDGVDGFFLDQADAGRISGSCAPTQPGPDGGVGHGAERLAEHPGRGHRAPRITTAGPAPSGVTRGRTG